MSSILDVKNNLIFVHIPKTAGSSITNLICSNVPDFDGKHEHNQEFVRLGRYHWTASKISQEYPKLFKDAISFAIVRNPFAWLQSIHYYQAASPTPPHHKKANELGFNGFVRYFIEQDKRSMKFFVCDQDNNILVNKVLRFEDFDSSVLPFLRRFYDLSELQHTMKTDKRDLSRDFDLDTFLLVKETYADDITLFGYEDLTARLEAEIVAELES